MLAYRLLAIVHKNTEIRHLEYVKITAYWLQFTIIISRLRIVLETE